MIGKIPKPGKTFAGCIEYNLQKKDAVILDAQGIRTGKIADTIADFNFQRKLNPGLGQAVGHIVLSWSSKDADKLNDGAMVNIAQTYLQRMKIQDTQVLIVKHQDKDHPHLHIVYNRVNNQGKTISDAFQYRNNVRITKALTLQYGFYMAPDKRNVNRPQLKGADKLKYELHDTIKTLSKKVTSMDELKMLLKQNGIEMLYKYKSGSKEVQGISFAKGDAKFKGSEIDRSLSYANLSKAISQQVQANEQAQAQQAPLSLADQLRQVIKEQQVEILPAFIPDISISDDVDDEAIYGKNRRREKKPRINSR
ncbi:relaxase/mobilization nuclease domain-containing protein [Mucilaginibacter jinjuensis]|uniref:Relaxase/mobilization nuclease domain-containing protein n=1 Tax=Mucilaginibacter jinjuensis TaxID=1176721 RepID=A0ABY7T8T0_9SPHI|nr:relaxase/mobilization nuclease domain-containing protein [Mucilaginibacter jinjuensis]WCT12291.1 relaxase/mobilization nuclease domain-containing protein [Mucilaginibacter jinjuensis]